MKEWLIENVSWLAPVIAALFSGTSLCSIISLVRTLHLSSALKKARESKYWTTCPRCHKKIYLDELVLRMPDGAVDDNINGVPDDQERIK